MRAWRCPHDNRSRNRWVKRLTETRRACVVQRFIAGRSDFRAWLSARAPCKNTCVPSSHGVHASHGAWSCRSRHAPWRRDGIDKGLKNRPWTVCWGRMSIVAHARGRETVPHADACDERAACVPGCLVRATLSPPGCANPSVRLNVPRNVVIGVAIRSRITPRHTAPRVITPFASTPERPLSFHQQHPSKATG